MTPFNLRGLLKVQSHMNPKVIRALVMTLFFSPMDFQKTFAELTSNEKNEISHRANAIEKLVVFLEKNPTFLLKFKIIWS